MFSIGSAFTPQRLSAPQPPAPMPAAAASPGVPSLGADTFSPALGRYYRIHAAFQAITGRAASSTELSTLDAQLGLMPTDPEIQAAVTAYARPALDPVGVRTLTKQALAPYFEAIARALAADPVLQAYQAAPALTPDQKLQLLERAKAIVGAVYQLAPIPTRVLDEAWDGGGYDFDTRTLAITGQMLASATPGDLLYLVSHELTHAFQDQLLDSPYLPAGPLGALVPIWGANQPHNGYVPYDPATGNFESYANQPLEFAAFLGGNVVEHAVTGTNSRTWGTALEAPEMITAIA